MRLADQQIYQHNLMLSDGFVVKIECFTLWLSTVGLVGIDDCRDRESVTRKEQSGLLSRNHGVSREFNINAKQFQDIFSHIFCKG